jgi:hypothetical protein
LLEFLKAREEVGLLGQQQRGKISCTIARMAGNVSGVPRRCRRRSSCRKA